MLHACVGMSTSPSPQPCRKHSQPHMPTQASDMAPGTGEAGATLKHRPHSGNRSFITHASHSFWKAAMSSWPSTALSVL